MANKNAFLSHMQSGKAQTSLCINAPDQDSGYPVSEPLAIKE